MANEQGNLGENQKSLEDKMPLIVEIIPGAAEGGLVCAYKIGEYDLSTTFSQMLSGVVDKEHSVEDAQIALRVREELSGGEYITDTRKIDIPERTQIRDYVQIRSTDDGLHKYNYLPIRIVKSQEGG